MDKMLKKRITSVIFALFFAGGLAVKTQAANPVITDSLKTTIGFFTGGDLGEGLDLKGNFVYALSIGADADFVSNKIQDVQFRGLIGSEVPGATLSAQFRNQNWYAVNYGDSANDNALEAATSSIRWSDLPNFVTLTLENLQIGTEYKFQMMFGEQCCNRGFDIFFDDALVVKDFNPGVAHERVAHGEKEALVTYTYTPKSSTVVLRFDGSEASADYSNHSPILNAVTVEKLDLAPLETSVVAGQTLTLTAGIAGANLAHRWQKDGVDLQASTRVSGVTSQTLTIQSVVASDSGSYRLTATNLTGSASAPAAVVTVLVPVSLTQQPQSVVGVEGETAQLSVTATGSPTPIYQWFKDANAVPSATNATLTLGNVRPAMVGDYTAVVSNGAGSVTSSVASLSIKGVDSGIWKGLVAYYPFNGNANDASGNFYNGTVQGATLVVDRNSSPSKSYSFDGGTKIDVGNQPTNAFDLIGDATLSLWVSVDKLQYQFPNCFIGKDVGPGTQPKWVFGLGADPNRADVKLYFEATTPGYERELHMTEFIAFPSNKYAHLVVVKTGKTLYIFKDGTKVYTGLMKRDLMKVPANLTIGYAEAPTPFIGSVDDVRIYNRALSDAEVKSLYSYESTPPSSGAVPEGMALIPAGTFQMGDDRVPEASPVHSVTVSAYAMDQKEVSIELWEKVRSWGNAHGYDLSTGGSYGPNRPVGGCSWYDIIKWNNARSEMEGHIPAYYEDSGFKVIYRFGKKDPEGVKWDTGYRLPTEAEWERAARGGVSGKLYPWGTDLVSRELANYSSNSRTVSVGSYQPNSYGLYDMAGNVWEWCWDWKDYYSAEAKVNPRGPLEGGERVVRGGGYDQDGNSIGVSVRYNYNPNSGGDRYGFRSVYPMTVIPVSLTQQPQSVMGVEGETVQLSVTAAGSPSPAYQWFKDGNAVPSGTNAVLTLANVRPAMIGDYTAVVSNAAGSVTSSVASLSIKGVDSGIWKGLVAYYPFNGNANDESGNRKPGILNGATAAFNRFGKAEALNFNGVSQFVSLPIAPILNNANQVTISLWVNDASAQQTGAILGNWSESTGGIYINDFEGSNIAVALLPNGQINTVAKTLVGTWKLVTVVFNGVENVNSKRLMMYLDGAPIDIILKYNIPINLPSGASSVLIGARQIGSAAGDYFSGQIDDVRIYNRALSEIEVKSLYDYESTPPVPTVTLAPVATSVVAGQTLTLTAGIAGANLAYRWQKDGVDLAASARLSGETSQTLTLQGVDPSDAGSYRLSATNLTGSASTPAAVVTVLVPVSVTQQPQSVVGIEGETVQLSVTATGSPTPTYQWLKNGQTITGPNLPTLSLANFAETDAGTYSVVVSNAVNAVTSTEAVVTYQAAIKILANGNPVTGTVRTLDPLSIELSFAKSDWLIFYTLDGSQPTFISTLYQEPFIITEPTSLRVVAYDGLYQNSYLGNPLSIRFLKPQTIDWGNPGAVRFGDTVTLKVASSSGLPVSVSVVSGPATLTGNVLKATGTGEVVLQALQSGTDDFAPVNAQRTITVSPARQTLTWPVLADQKFGNPPVGVPVTAQSGLPVVLTVASGKASAKGATVTLSGAGEVVLRAEQSGNANYEAISETRSFKVAKAEQTLTVPTIANRAFNPQPFTPSAVVSSGLPVKFMVLSGPALIEQGAVKLTGVGSVLLRAEQPGNDDYEATLPVDKTFVVSKGDQTLTFDAVGGRTFGDTAVTLTAKSSSALSVSYRVVSGPGTISGTSLTLTGAGTVLVQALQAGDANYNPAAANQSIVVAKATQSITFPALANVGYSTNAMVLKATSSSGLAVAYRVVQGAATLSGNVLSLSGVGAVSVAADKAGDGNYLPAISVTNAFTVARGDQTIAFTAIGDQVLGNAPIPLKGTSSVGLPVTFQLVSGPATVSSGALTLLGEGTVTVRARQVGSPLYNPAQTDQSLVIRKLTTLAVTVAGNQGGTVAVTPLKDLYAPADTVSLTAKATGGFAFSGWSGDVTGLANPATLAMSANRAVTASFKDTQAPALTWDLPAAGSTGVEQVRLSGKITDNVGVITAQWSREGGTGQALTLQANGSFSVDNVTLTVGTNRFAIVARDAAGNESKLERQVVWVPQRILTVGDAVAVQEGQRLVFPLSLNTDTLTVAGLTFKLTFDPTWVADPQLEWAGAAGQSVNNINLGTAGELTGSFAMAGVGLPIGSNRIATVSFRARSVPVATNVIVRPSIVSLGSVTGVSLNQGNAVVSGAGRITTRRIKGDNNANQRVDVGDAVLISRYEVGLEEKRAWDIGLNDLNQSGSLDNGDIIKALRTVVGLDPQPSPGSEGKRLASGLHLADALGLAKVLVNTNDAMAIELLDGPKATAGQPYRVAVRLNRVKGSLSGLSFALKYPASLTLTDKQVGALVPGDALPFWNESAGQVSLAAIRSTAWANATGVAAVLTFVPSAGFSAQAEWPLKLELVEITGSGFDVRPVDPVVITIQSGGGTVNTPPQIALEPPAADGSLTLEIRAPKGATVAVETTSDLNTWTETQSITGQGAGSPVKVTLQPDPTVQAKFWRVRVR